MTPSIQNNLLHLKIPPLYCTDLILPCCDWPDRLPFSIRVLLESAVRNCDNFAVTERDVSSILDWEKNQNEGAEPVELNFKPARVILQVRQCIA